jgi:tetratricopeptide (TPR) repeat protein
MAAKKKTTKKSGKKAPQKVEKAKPRRNWVAWAYGNESEEASSSTLHKVYYGLLALSVVTLLGLALVTGINADEKFQDDYSEKLVDYYASGGGDKAALYEDDTSSQRFNKFYGGFFELVSGSVNRMLGYHPGPSYHRVRHLLNALFGVLILVIVAGWSRRMAGIRAGILAIILMLASPRLLGHSVMNPKDIPFAAGYLMGAFYLYRCLLSMPRPRWQDALGFVLGAALATATRAGGILIFCYSGLFLGIDFLLRYGVKGIAGEFKQFLTYAAYWIGSTLVGFGLALLFWPYALQAPLEHTKEALDLFSNYAVRIIILFGGENMFSDGIPSSYPLVWLGISVALSVIAGFFLSLLTFPGLVKKHGVIPVVLLLFVTIFPLAYIMFKESALYDGWRQLLFIYPTVLVLGALGFEYLAQRFTPRTKWAGPAIIGIVVLLSADALLFTARNPALAYVYFNPLAGGIKGAFGQYELDYWGLSSRQAVEWMEDEGILHPGMDTLTIGTTFPYNVRRQLDLSYKKKVKIQYIRYHRRFSESWDYGIFPSRFIRGPHLRNNTWPTSKTVHRIEANGVPLAVVEHDPDQFAMQAEALLKAGQAPQAIQRFQQEVAKYPDNEQGWNGLASAQVSIGDGDQALTSAAKALEIAPDNETALYLKGYAYLTKNNGPEALNTFNHLLQVDPENAMAYYWIGEIYKQRKELETAFNNFRKAIEYNPKLKQAYLSIATIFEEQGDMENANRYRNAAAQF